MKSRGFGNYIKSIREEKNIPLRVLAQYLNIDSSTLSKIENGHRSISFELLPGIANVLDLKYKDLQIKYIKEKIKSEYKSQPFLKEALQSLNTDYHS